MAKLVDLLQGYTGNTPEELQAHIQDRAKELKLKLFLDDGDKNIFVPKARLDSEIVKNVELKKTIAEQEAAMKKLNDLTKDNEKAQQTISELESKMTTMKETMKENNLSLALRAKAMELKAIDETGQDLLAFIDKSKLIVNDDGTVTGLDDALKSLKASKQYLFHAEEQNLQGGQQGTPSAGTGAPGRPSAGNVPGSKSTKPGDFGALLSSQFSNNMSLGNTEPNSTPMVTPTYDFFK